jgi:glycosyltransferase involved in cell wall biosynthesis
MTDNQSPVQETFSILVATFAYEHYVLASQKSWYGKTMFEAQASGTVKRLAELPIKKFPTDVARNHSVEVAKEGGYDYLLMMDHDIDPHPDFWKRSWGWMVAHRATGPCVVAAPYCSGTPERVLAFIFENLATENPDPDFRIECISRYQAAQLSGFHRVAAVGTGMILWDMRVFDYLAKPYFAYEYNEDCTNADSTEDIVATRNLALQGIPIWCDFDCWCGHLKLRMSHKPQPLSAENLGKSFVKELNTSFKVQNLQT